MMIFTTAFLPFTPVRFPCSVRTRIYLYLTLFLRSIIFSSFSAVHGYLCTFVVGCIRTTDEYDISPPLLRSAFEVLSTHVGRWEGGPDLRNLSSGRRLYSDSKGMSTRPSLCIVHRVISGSTFPRHTMVLLQFPPPQRIIVPYFI